MMSRLARRSLWTRASRASLRFKNFYGTEDANKFEPVKEPQEIGAIHE